MDKRLKQWVVSAGLAALSGLVLAVGLTGCGTVSVQVNAYRSRELEFPSASSNKQMVVEVQSQPDEPLLRQEVKGKVEFLLRHRGYFLAEPNEARYVMRCRFGIDAGQKRMEYYSVHEPYYHDPFRVYGGYYYPGYHVGFGYRHYVPYTYVLFGKYLALTLYDLERVKAGQDYPDESVVWHVTVNRVDESSDLRRGMNVLLAGAFELFGKDTGEQKVIRFKRDDARVELLKTTPVEMGGGRTYGESRSYGTVEE